MGASLTKNLKPQELTEFKKLPTTTLLDNIEIPERAENRVPTDRKFIIVFIVILILLFPFLIYTLVYSDIGRFYGFDDCGNICGKNNTKYEQWACTGKDYTDKRYLQYNENPEKLTIEELRTTHRECVHQCSKGYTLLLRQCIKFEKNYDYDKDILDEEVGTVISDYLKNVAWRIVLAGLICIVITLGVIFLMRTATAVVVWGILGGSVLFGCIIIGFLWYSYVNYESRSREQNNEKNGVLFVAVLLTIILLILFCVMAFMYKKIKLVILLLKEAMKASFAMPLLIFTPILTFFAFIIVLILFVTTTLYIATSGTLTEIIPGYLDYKMNPVMIFTAIFNLCMTFWGLQILIGLQYMIIAGAVAKWYFAKNKDNLGGPILTSASITFKYHIGTIVFGSLIITLIAIIRFLLTSLAKNKTLKICVDICLGSIETFLKFLSKNAYIMTAMHGKPFYKSGKRATKIILQNAVNIASINFVGDFVLVMAQILIILITMLITVGLMQGTDTNLVWIAYIIVFIISVMIAATFFSTFETTIDTIFLCFCEDSLLNDGMARPYAMSRGLMEFVENSKKIYGEKTK